jgi:hypothetical protein
MRSGPLLFTSTVLARGSHDAEEVALAQCD